MSSLQARTFTRAAGTRAAGTAVNHAARLELLEQYLAHHEDIVRCAQASVDWLSPIHTVAVCTRSSIAKTPAASGP